MGSKKATVGEELGATVGEELGGHGRRAARLPNALVGEARPLGMAKGPLPELLPISWTEKSVTD